MQQAGWHCDRVGGEAEDLSRMGQVLPRAHGKASKVLFLQTKMQIFRKLEEQEKAWKKHLVTHSTEMTGTTGAEFRLNHKK